MDIVIVYCKCDGRLGALAHQWTPRTYISICKRCGGLFYEEAKSFTVSARTW